MACTIKLSGISFLPAFPFETHRGTDEVAEQWMRAIRAALEFRVELRGHEPGMVCQFHHLDKAVVGRTPTDDHAVRLHAFAILVIEFVAMTVTLKNNGFVVSGIGFGARRQTTDPVAQAHGATLSRQLALRHHQVNDGIGTLRVKFGAVGTGEIFQYVTRKLDYRDLHTEAEAEVGNVLATSEVRGLDLALDATRAEPPGTTMPSTSSSTSV